jgi:DNA-binding NarL/FixJ family response regulator
MGIRIMIADDHKLLREGLKSLISEQEDMTVVGEARDGGSAVRLAAKKTPDVVIMDVSMPGVNGVEATRRIRASWAMVRVLALSMHAQARIVVEILSAGASGYLLKDCAFEEVIRAIETVASGNVYLSGKIADAVVKDYLLRVPREGPFPHLSGTESEILGCMAERKEVGEIARLLHISERDAESRRGRLLRNRIIPALSRAYEDDSSLTGVMLTAREMEILVWLKEGKSSAEIGSQLGVSEDTVKFHLKNVYQKLNATNRSHAVAVALASKLIEP